MKTTLLTFAAALAVAPLCAQHVRTVVQNGPSDELYDMVILGDGYLASDEAQFDADVLDIVNYFRTNPTKFPYGAYFNLYNVHTVFRASNERGADKPPLNIFVDTAYDASYWTGGTERCLYIGNTARASADAALAPDTDGRVIVIVNDSKYGGCAGTFSVCYNGTSMEEVQAHEWGHSFGGLADEYDYGRTGTYSGPEPSQPNITADPTGARKWAPWLGFAGPHGTVGAYVGAGYYQTGLYRPEPDCEMRSLSRYFCTVCRQQMILRFNQECVMFAQPTPSPIAAQRGGSVQIGFTNRIAGRPHAIDWRVDGGPWQAGTASFTWNVGAASSGAHTIEARLTDTSAEVRQDPRGDLVHLHAWRVDVTPSLLDAGITEVLPARAGSAEGDSATTDPFAGTSALRAMYSYASAAARRTAPVHVRAVALRPDSSAVTFAGATWDLALDVSTGRNAPGALSRTFDANHGGDRARVFDGPLTIPAQTLGATPRPFSLIVPFAEPFAWNPSSGPLLLDLRLRSRLSGAGVTTDAATAIRGDVSRIANLGDPNATTANFPASGVATSAPVVELILDLEVSPDANALVEGPTWNTLGFASNVPQRLMEIRDGATFGATGGRHLVTALAWRPDAGQAWPGGRAIDMRVEMSTGAPNLSTATNTTFDLNHGADRRTVFEGIWTPPASPSGGLAPFVLRLDLQRPFEFDPASGSLVVDLHIRGATGTAGVASDAVAPATGLRTLWSFGDPNGPTAILNQVTTSVIGLVAVPQPVLPESADAIPGNAQLSRPFGVAGATRSMTAYAPAVLGATEPVEITHLSWRVRTGPVQPVTWRARIDLSSGGALPLGATFDPNHGADRTTVFDGRFSATRSAAGAFSVEVALDTPFRWDPSRGPLIVDVRKQAELGGAVAFTLDAVDSASLSFAAHTTDANAAVADRPIAARGQVVRLGGTVPANALATPYGAGCGGTTPVVHGSTGLPWLGNAGFELAAFDARAQASAAVVLGIGRVATPLDPLGYGGCTLLTDAVLGTIAATTDASGTATAPAAIPGDPTLAGVTLTSQWLVLDPAGVRGLALSDGLEIEAR
ncbi:MAG: hypothetical protein IPM29_05865 [Planctomycetes bacterium]|nr:hypothetical protein [Planctomycetota bacterium]